jgi:hypothetical protein
MSEQEADNTENSDRGFELCVRASDWSTLEGGRKCLQMYSVLWSPIIRTAVIDGK